MKIYYAHCMAIYSTPQEQRDVELLSRLGDVVNPATPEVEGVVSKLPSGAERMAYFERFADNCDMVAFRALPGGAIPGGVAKEVGWFQQRGKPVIELPNFSFRQQLDHQGTKLYLSEVGQR